ncbi:probable glutathione S-transferase GSTF1 isoform X1 [Dendrobium catenatum]|uniref:glutathione transferase n=1 Tax=Dendrobium catenatum TaxID=906689 RepID=A0A2I0VRU0_9ASPA|nr:probable glutathione S-transferase GSTF1 isoform X1 [Dendrobium catenatum]PKU66121.1 putative glutathione S-transferase GSTF1 [Dendrobium catenatum]
MAVTVYGPSYSTATARVIACLEVYGVEYRQVPVDLVAAEHKQQAVLYGNPFGQVPVFEDGDLKLFESRAITRYIAKKYKRANGPDLLKEDNLEESTMVNIWMEVEAHQLDKAVQPIIFQLLVVPVLLGGAPDQKIVENSVKNVEKLLDVYEARLSESKYLAGDFFSLADLNHLPYLHYLINTPYASAITSRPHVKGWWEDLLSRPACQKVTANMKR